MTVPEAQKKILVKLHIGLFYFLIAWFLTVTVIFTFNAELARTLSYWGVIFIIAGTVIRLLTMAVQFYKQNQFRYWLLCGLIILLIAMTRILAYIF